MAKASCVTDRLDCLCIRGPAVSPCAHLLSFGASANARACAAIMIRSCQGACHQLGRLDKECRCLTLEADHSNWIVCPALARVRICIAILGARSQLRAQSCGAELPDHSRSHAPSPAHVRNMLASSAGLVMANCYYVSCKVGFSCGNPAYVTLCLRQGVCVCVQCVCVLGGVGVRALVWYHEPRAIPVLLTVSTFILLCKPAST